jgi:hypothetical protein
MYDDVVRSSPAVGDHKQMQSGMPCTDICTNMYQQLQLLGRDLVLVKAPSISAVTRLLGLVKHTFLWTTQRSLPKSKHTTDSDIVLSWSWSTPWYSCSRPWPPRLVIEHRNLPPACCFMAGMSCVTMSLLQLKSLGELQRCAPTA